MTDDEISDRWRSIMQGWKKGSRICYSTIEPDGSLVHRWGVATGQVFDYEPIPDEPEIGRSPGTHETRLLAAIANAYREPQS